MGGLPLSVNNVIETTASSGTGNITLGGAYNNADAFATGNLSFFDSKIPLALWRPYMIRDKLGNWEKGRGYLTNATTFVRGEVLANSAGTFVKLDFPAGDKLIFVPSEARALGSSVTNNFNWITSPHSIGYKSGRALVANTLYYTPHLQPAPVHVKAIGLRVTTAAASTQARLGIYNLKRQSDSGANYDTFYPLAVDLGTVDTSTTGDKFIAVDFVLPEGAYLMATISNGAPSVNAHGSQNIFNVVLPGAASTMGDHIAMLQQGANAANFTALPAETFGALTQISNQNPPAIYLRGHPL